MWILKSTNADDCFYIFGREQYNVGRMGGKHDIVLKGDTSISRTHAVLYFAKGDTETLDIQDMGSKFGTFRNGTGLAERNRITLSDEDLIKFGQLHNTWKVLHMPFKSMTSALPEDQAILHAKYLSELGGKVLQQWHDSCTHLTMAVVSVTIKVLHALLEQIPIVTCDYWRDMLQAVCVRAKSLPLTDDYIPQCCETIINQQDVDLKARPERKYLFAGMTFVFMNHKHFNLYGPIVKKAGAEYRDFNSGGGVHKSFLVNDKVVVIQYVPSTQSQSSQIINTIEEFLEKNSRRIIPEYEIGLAIMHCSVLKYCNPSYKLVNDLLSSSERSIPLREASHSILVQNTHVTNNSSSVSLSESVLIPETEANNQLRKKIVETVVPCEEEDYMSSIFVTESVEEQSRNKRKHHKEASMNYEDIDEHSFKNTKKLCPNNDVIEEQSKQQETLETTNEVTKKAGTFQTNKLSSNASTKNIASKRITVDVSGFIEKSQSLYAPNRDIVDCEEASSSAARKRPHINIITEDGDDDDLFNFASSASTSTKKTRMSVENFNNRSNEGLFEFTSQSNDCVDKVAKCVGSDSEDMIPTEHFVAQESSKCSRIQLPTPKALPKKVSTEGWLCSSLSEVKFEPDSIKIDDKQPDVKQINADNAENSESLINQKWVDSLKDGCQVKMCSFNFNTHAKERVEKQKSTANNKNFKNFVKQAYRSG